MSTTPDWLHGHDHPSESDTGALSIGDVVAWIAGIVVIADLLFLAQRFVG